MLRYDGVEVHSYWLSNEDGKIVLSTRGKLQGIAAALLYKNGISDNFLATGGNMWGEQYPSLSQLMKEQMVRYGVPESRIISVGASMTTQEEIEDLRKVSVENGWNRIADLAYRPHHCMTIPRLCNKQAPFPAPRNLSIPMEGKLVTMLDTEDVMNELGNECEKQSMSRLKKSVYEKNFWLYETVVGLTQFLFGNYNLQSIFAYKSRGHMKTRNEPWPGMPIDEYNL